jgi:hypothetical protein
MKKWHLWGIIVLLVAFIAYTMADSRSEAKQAAREAEKVAQRYNDTIAIISARIREKNRQILEISEHLDSVNDQYHELARRGPDLKLDSLQKMERVKGQKTFGIYADYYPPKIRSALYGNQALDNVVLLRRKVSDLKTIPVEYRGVIIAKDSIISAQGIAITKIRKADKKAYWRGFATGGASTAITILALILLL